jgi:hypothetical protein
VIPHATLDVYEFWNLRPSFALEGLKAGHLDEWTTGFRWVGALPESFDYRTEMAYQLGTLSVDKIRAWMGHWVLGYTVQKAPLRPRFFFEYDYGSGSPNDKADTTTRSIPSIPAPTISWAWRTSSAGGISRTAVRPGIPYRPQMDRGHQLPRFLAGQRARRFVSRARIHHRGCPQRGGRHPRGVELDVQAIYTPTRQTQSISV